MDIHKITHGICETAKHWHLFLIVGLIGSVRLNSKMEAKDIISDLEDVPGDNILPSGDNFPAFVFNNSNLRRSWQI